jgi:hypothetical protein
MLWVYRKTCNKLTIKTPFILVYGHEVVMSMEFNVTIRHIVTLTKLIDLGAVERIRSKLLELEEDRFFIGFR